MSRVANAPVNIVAGVKVNIAGQKVQVSGKNGSLEMNVHKDVEVKQDGDAVNVAARNNSQAANALAGTTRALVQNMVTGVTEGFERKLVLVGVGYRAKAAGKNVSMSLGYSHSIEYALPEGVSADSPSQTEIVLKSANKQLLGQVASELRGFRPPEPYKGKGVRYSDEVIRRKEAKKK